MKRFLAIMTLAAACSNGQTATNRVAVDVANSVVSYRDFVADGDYTNSLRLWLPFLVAPTGATYSAGDCSRSRVTFNQTNSSARPVWTNGGMKFDGTNDYLISTTRQTSASGTLIARISPASGPGYTTHVFYAQGSLASASNAAYFQTLDQSGTRTNVARFIAFANNSSTANVEYAASLTVAATSTMTLAFVTTGTNILIYQNGIQLPTWTPYGGYTGQWWSVGIQSSAVGAILRGAGTFYSPGTVHWLQLYDRALSSAEVYRVSMQGPTR